MKSASLITISFLLTSFCAFSQSFEKKFADLSTKGDTTGELKLLKEWKAASPKDAEYFVAGFNYYANKSRHEVLSLDRVKKDDNAIAINDTATGQPVGYMNTIVKYDPVMLQKGFDCVDQGLALYPTRLDMRFGKIYMLGQEGDFAAFTNVLVETIDYGNTIKYAWTWKEGKPLDDAKNFFLGSMQDYELTIYNTNDDSLLPYMRQIAQEVLKYNPNHVESLDDVALTYLISGDYDQALTYLLKAESAAPKDCIVLNNIAEAYKRKGDKANAQTYYQKIIQCGNEDDVKNAQEQLKTLNQ